MPVEVVVKDEYIAIYIDRKRMLGWLRDVPGALEFAPPVPWEGDSTDDKHTGGSSTDKSEPQGVDQDKVDKLAEELRIEHEKQEGYKTGEGETKEFPNPVDSKDVVKPDPNGEEVPGSIDGISLFDEGPTGQSGTLQDAPKGKDKLKQMRDWMTEEKFNYRNFCLFLLGLKEVGGFKLGMPVIGVTKAKKEPTLLQLAFRYYSYWLSAKESIAIEYKQFLIDQLAEMGVTIKMVEDMLDGEEIDPKSLPKGIKVTT
jgi:hypothetical protein